MLFVEHFYNLPAVIVFAICCLAWTFVSPGGIAVRLRLLLLLLIRLLAAHFFFPAWLRMKANSLLFQPRFVGSFMCCP